MLGSLRLVLALLVVVSHLVGSHDINHYGAYAVRGFFILSGFVITAALNDAYRFDLPRFAINRLLRIMPGYLLVCVVTLLLIEMLPHDAAAFHPRWQAGYTASDVIQNLVLFPLSFDPLDLRLFEPGWSLGVELMMYALLAVGLARNMGLAVVGLVFGIAYHAALLWIGAPFELRYFAPPAAVLSFAIGAIIYFVRAQHPSALQFPSKQVGIFTILVVWFGNLVLAPQVLGGEQTFLSGYYLDVVYFGLLVLLLDPPLRGSVAARIDHVLGELAYPVFLVQWVAGFIAHEVFVPQAQRGWELFFYTLPITFVLGGGLALLQVRLIDPWRRTIRHKAMVPNDSMPGLAHS